MGMDVIGNNPKSETGSYFRNNVWWWRPLAQFVQEAYPEIAEQCQYWDSNDGDGLDEEYSLILAKRIREDLANGTVEQWETDYNKWRSELPRTECELCNSTGIRTDEIGVEMGMPTRELSTEISILVGRTHGYCNGCGGVGTQENWLSHYPVAMDNVRQFADFLEDCGGFSIC
jgi:hypothetical protein